MSEVYNYEDESSFLSFTEALAGTMSGYGHPQAKGSVLRRRTRKISNSISTDLQKAVMHSYGCTDTAQVAKGSSSARAVSNGLMLGLEVAEYGIQSSRKRKQFYSFMRQRYIEGTHSVLGPGTDVLKNLNDTTKPFSPEVLSVCGVELGVLPEDSLFITTLGSVAMTYENYHLNYGRTSLFTRLCSRVRTRSDKRREAVQYTNKDKRDLRILYTSSLGTALFDSLPPPTYIEPDV